MDALHDKLDAAPRALHGKVDALHDKLDAAPRLIRSLFAVVFEKLDKLDFLPKLVRSLFEAVHVKLDALRSRRRAGGADNAFRRTDETWQSDVA